jgi:cytochrome c-type biogenesis protein CcmH/NrfF
MTRALLAVLALALFVVGGAAASEEHPTLAELEQEVVCPTCHTTLALSDAPIADRMRAFIRQRIAAGDTKSKIKAQLVDQFGEAVLAAPSKRGFNLLAWGLPLSWSPSPRGAGRRRALRRQPTPPRTGMPHSTPSSSGASTRSSPASTLERWLVGRG